MYYSIKLYVFICDDCNSNDEFCDVADARANGWAISKNHDACYCPNCAPAHRNTGRGGVKNGVSNEKPLKKDTRDGNFLKKIWRKIFYTRRRR